MFFFGGFQKPPRSGSPPLTVGLTASPHFKLFELRGALLIILKIAKMEGARRRRLRVIIVFVLADLARGTMWEVGGRWVDDKPRAIAAVRIPKTLVLKDHRFRADFRRLFSCRGPTGCTQVQLPQARRVTRD